MYFPQPARLQAYDPAPVEDSDAHRTLLDQVSPGLVKNVIELKPIPNIHDLAASYNKREMTYTDPGIVTETENDVADDEDDDHSPTTVANHTEIGRSDFIQHNYIIFISKIVKALNSV